MSFALILCVFSLNTNLVSVWEFVILDCRNIERFKYKSCVGLSNKNFDGSFSYVKFKYKSCVGLS